MLKTLRNGSTGYLVTQWQTFLRGQEYFIEVSGTFDDETENATRSFQKKYRLDADGIVGNQTFGKAALLGFELVEFSETEAKYPGRPYFLPLIGNLKRQEVFGPLVFTAAPGPKNPEAIKITNGWDKANLTKIQIPQLAGIKGASREGTVWFHKKVAYQFVSLWKAWESAGLLDLVLTFDGAYTPRFVRGNAHEQVLSNHAFATAFDINHAWNKLGAEPATQGKPGCVYGLVPLAHQHGFFWGGHFTRKDGMHFEVACIHKS